MSFEQIKKISDLSKDTADQTRVMVVDDPDQLKALLHHLEKIGTTDDSVDPIMHLITYAAEKAMWLPYGLEMVLTPDGENRLKTTFELYALDVSRNANKDVFFCDRTFNIAYRSFVAAILKLSKSIQGQDLTVETEATDRGNRSDPGKRIFIQRGKGRPPVSARSSIIGMSTSRKPASPDEPDKTEPATDASEPSTLMSSMPATTRDTPHSRNPPAPDVPNVLPTVPPGVRPSGFVPAGTTDQAASPPPPSVPLPSHRVVSLGPPVMKPPRPTKRQA